MYIAAPDFFSWVTWAFFSHKVAPVGVEKPAYAGVLFVAAHGGRLLGQHRDDWDNILLFFMESWNHWNHGITGIMESLESNNWHNA